VFLALHCARPVLAAQRSTEAVLPFLHDEIGDGLISTRVLRSLTLDGVWLAGEIKAGCCFGECLGDPVDCG
jgi:hypothetical protein